MVIVCEQLSYTHSTDVLPRWYTYGLTAASVSPPLTIEWPAVIGLYTYVLQRSLFFDYRGTYLWQPQFIQSPNWISYRLVHVLFRVVLTSIHMYPPAYISTHIRTLNHLGIDRQTKTMITLTIPPEQYILGFHWEYGVIQGHGTGKHGLGHGELKNGGVGVNQLALCNETNHFECWCFSCV